MIGNTLSHYKIIEKLGQGGMGEVYLAEDSRLDRKVALKILPQHLSERAELRERFEREARAVSSLNHPHICTLYDIGEQGGIHFLVMEHLVGETLEARLAKGALPLEQTLEYAIQIADALDKAHRQGVVHRDLKPGNIMLVKSGAKLLDFGLAKLQATETPTNLSALPTEQANLTAEGTILGTLQYMAPEQLEGKEADSRTDIFAFGAVVYEMATGKKAFEGKSQASLIAAIMGQDPRPMSELKPMTPELLDWVVKRCLAKEPDERWQTANDLMAGLKQTTEVGTSVDSFPSVSAPAAWKRVMPWSIAGLIAVIAGVGFWILTRPLPRLPARFVITSPPSTFFANNHGTDVLVSPDGSYVVYRALDESTTRLYLHHLNEFTGRPIPGTEGADRYPFFSPNGQSVAFVVGGKLKRVSLLGGPPVTICDAPIQEGGSWDAEDTIVFAADLGSGTGLYRVSANGGKPESLTMPDPEEGESEYQQPQILPGEKAVLFTVFRADLPYRIYVLSLETGEKKIVLEGGKQAHYASSGHLIYEQSGTRTLMAAPFEVRRLEVIGKPVPVLQGVRGTGAGGVDYAVSSDGTLVYIPAGESTQRSLVWVDREGGESLVTEERHDYGNPRISPDGMLVAVEFHEDNTSNVWIYDLETDRFRRLTFGEGSKTAPIWTADSRRIIFRNQGAGSANLYHKRADGSGSEELLITGETGRAPLSLSPDGSLLAIYQNTGGSGDISILPMEGDLELQPFIASTNFECCARFSPDGRWIAYVSNETGVNQVYVSPVQEPHVKWLVSGEEGGEGPVWDPDGTGLFYRSSNRMMAVSVLTGPSFSTGKPSVLFEGSYATNSRMPGTQFYDVSTDGKRFLMIHEDEINQLNVITNWFEELKRLVPTN